MLARRCGRRTVLSRLRFETGGDDSAPADGPPPVERGRGHLTCGRAPCFHHRRTMARRPDGSPASADRGQSRTLNANMRRALRSIQAAWVGRSREPRRCILPLRRMLVSVECMSDDSWPAAQICRYVVSSRMEWKGCADDRHGQRFGMNPIAHALTGVPTPTLADVRRALGKKRSVHVEASSHLHQGAPSDSILAASTSPLPLGGQDPRPGSTGNR